MPTRAHRKADAPISDRRSVVRALVALTVFGFCPIEAGAVRVVTYNLLNYSSGRTTEFKLILNELQADVVVAQEIDTGGQSNFLNTVLNAPDGPGGYQMATFTNGPYTDNALFYRSAAITFTGPGDHVDLSTSPRPTDRWRLGLVGYGSNDAKFYVYSMHLKAGNTPSDETKRATAATIIRNNANALQPATHFLFCGDFNVYTSGEAAYQMFVGSQADNDGRGFDPISQPGAWHNNASFALIHTQSTHSNNANPPPGGSYGGLDDRFDHLLVSAAMNDAQGLSYVGGTYRSYGNDGAHFNGDINDAPMIPEGWSVANALHGASDHLPVMMDVQVPAVIPAPAPLDFGQVIVGATAELALSVWNAGDIALFGLVDTLAYDLKPPPGYNAPGGTFTDDAGGGGNTHTIAMLTDVSGTRDASLAINTNAPDAPVRLVSLLGSVLDHAVPSSDPNTQVLVASLDFGTLPVGGGPTAATVTVYNVGYKAFQSKLEVYDAAVTGDPAFSVDFTPTTDITQFAQFTVWFDATDLCTAAYTAALVFSTRDDQNLPGAVDLPSITFNLTASISALLGDFDLDGIVGISDTNPFLAVLLDPGSASAGDQCIADMNQDGVNDGKDIGVFVDVVLQ